MPTFDFQCQKCETIFEFSRAFGSKTIPACPACGSKRTQKLMTPPTIQFKGSGFYKTDSSRSHMPPKKTPNTAKKEPQTAPSESAEAKPPATSAEKKGDAEKK
jgi:putative FmdB family regulatory protein